MQVLTYAHLMEMAAPDHLASEVMGMAMARAMMEMAAVEAEEDAQADPHWLPYAQSLLPSSPPRSANPTAT